MPSNSKTRQLSPNATKLKELLSSSRGGGGGEDADQNRASIEYIKSNYNFEEAPHLEDLINLVKAIENVNQQLLIENKFFREQSDQQKAAVFKLIEENNALHKELKNITVQEILAEFQNDEQQQANNNINGQSPNNKSKDEELYQNQLLINELQKKLSSEQSKNNKSTMKKSNADTLDNVDTFLGTKFNEEMEIKIRQIENLNNEIEQLKKSKAFLKAKVDEYEVKESEFEAQMKKYVDLVKHLELERNHAIEEKELVEKEKLSADKKLESILVEFNEKITKEKEIVLSNVDGHIKSLLEQNQNLEQMLFKQESLVDRLTRDKVSLTSELESYKQKCNSIDFDNHHMAEKLRNKYSEVLKERDLAISEAKRIRHDYELYVKQNDQDKFSLRDELNNARHRLLEGEKDLLQSREQCIRLTEEINQLQAEMVRIKHSKEVVEVTRVDNLKELKEKYEKRESQLAQGIEAIQARYCVTVKEMEDLTEIQRKLINKFKDECKTLNEQLEVLVLRYRNDTQHLSNECDELNVRLKKYEKRLNEYEEQSVKHLNLHEKMKERLKELTVRLQEQQEEKLRLQSSETLMKTTNIQLMSELNGLRNQLSLYTVPSRFRVGDEKSASSKLINMMPTATSLAENQQQSLAVQTARDNTAALNSVRSLIESAMNSIKA